MPRYKLMLTLRKIIYVRALTEKKKCGNGSHEKETKHIYVSTADLLQIRIGNLDWCKRGHC